MLGQRLPGLRQPPGRRRRREVRRREPHELAFVRDEKLPDLLQLLLLARRLAARQPAARARLPRPGIQRCPELRRRVHHSVRPVRREQRQALVHQPVRVRLRRHRRAAVVQRARSLVARRVKAMGQQASQRCQPTGLHDAET